MADMICRQKKPAILIRVSTLQHANVSDTPKQQFH